MQNINMKQFKYDRRRGVVSLPSAYSDSFSPIAIAAYMVNNPLTFNICIYILQLAYVRNDLFNMIDVYTEGRHEVVAIETDSIKTYSRNDVTLRRYLDPFQPGKLKLELEASQVAYIIAKKFYYLVGKMRQLYIIYIT